MIRNDVASDMGRELLPKSVEALLDIARRRLNMDVSWVSRFADGDQVLEHVAGDIDNHGIAAGSRSDLDGSFCVRVLDGRLGNIVTDTQADPATAHLPVTDDLNIGSYVGVPMTGADGTTTGMLCCISSQPSNHLDNSDVRSMELFAELLSHVLTNDPADNPHDRAIEQAITATLENDGLYSVFQPIVNIRAAAPAGVEALCRFDDPATRPDIWFAQAASVGLGIDAELAAIATALSHLGQLEPPLYMSLNASPATISDPRLVALLGASDPSRLVIELTEHDEIDDYATFITDLAPLRRLGVKIAIDDVGAGFSSFAHVLQIKPDIVKIDRSITTNIDTDLARQALATAIGRVAEQIGATVVAEGVETQPELDALASLDIAYAQGYLLAKPGPLGTDINTDAVRAVTIETGNSLLATPHFDLAMRHSPIGIAIVDTDGSFLHTNPALGGLLGYTSNRLNSLTFQQLTHPDDLDHDLDLLNECLVGERDSYRIEKRYVHADGSIIAADLTVALVRSTSSGEARFFISQIQPVKHEDPTDRHGDALTGTATHDQAQQHIQQLIADRCPFGIIQVRILDLNTITDTHGRHAADHILISVATRLNNTTRPTDTVARTGNDTFTLIIPTATPSTLHRLQERIRNCLAGPVTLFNTPEPATPQFSIDIEHHPQAIHTAAAT